MPECRRCGVALAWHEDSLCRECWDATEADCDEMAEQDAEEAAASEVSGQ
jgi:hypothetical protein